MSAVKDVIDGLDETKIDKDWIIKKICEQWISIEHQIYEKNKEIDTSLNRRNPFDDNEINLIWKDGENTVSIFCGKRHYEGGGVYKITLNNDTILFDMHKGTLSVMRWGPWIERFKKFVIEHEKALLDVEQRVRELEDQKYNQKFGDVDF